jgi:hypothetical protein
MSDKNSISEREEKKKTEKKLDKALADTFPASDPVALESNLISGRPAKDKNPRSGDSPHATETNDSQPDSKKS